MNALRKVASSLLIAIALATAAAADQTGDIRGIVSDASGGYPIGGGEPLRVGELQAGEQVLEWTADGRGLLVGRTGAKLQVDRLDLDTWKREPWRTFGLADPVGVTTWTLFMTPDGRSYAYGYWRALDDLYLVEGLR